MQVRGLVDHDLHPETLLSCIPSWFNIAASSRLQARTGQGILGETVGTTLFNEANKCNLTACTYMEREQNLQVRTHSGKIML